MFGMIGVAKQMVLILLTEKWLPCVFFVQMACLSYMLLPIQTANCQAILAKGRSDVNLIMEIVKKAFGVGILLFTLHKGVNAIAVGAVAAVFISAVICMIPNKSIMGYSILEQLKDLAPSYLMSFVMLAAVLFIGKLHLPTVLLLIIQVFTGAGIYLGLSALFKVDSFYYILKFIKKYLGQRKASDSTLE